uniref:Uncharacterized protein n=1 Tax=Setaria viridis TaxID=4556 RepID=A0A4U6VW58_SETVI|nr:hypothetical protein SEVIR_2G285950v2 [Setaria viridis]
MPRPGSHRPTNPARPPPHVRWPSASRSYDVGCSWSWMVVANTGWSRALGQAASSEESFYSTYECWEESTGCH